MINFGIKKDIKRVFLIVSLILSVTSIVACGNKEEDYRQIQVYKIDGSATVARAGSSMDVYENMQLQSGDVVETVANSYVQLKLDEDKYILLEPETKISLQATGNSADSNTSIFLEKGAIVNQLDNALSKDSSYQVTTPNSTMAVRGTTFRVEITYDENGESFAKVAVYSGKVECMLVFPDGTVQEPVMIEGGMEVLVRGDDVESEYVMTGKTSYEELKEKVLDFLHVAIERGKELSISKEEIEVLIEVQKALEEDGAVVEEVPEEDVTEEDATEESEEEFTEAQTQEKPADVEEEEPKGEEIKEEQKPEVQQPMVTPSAPPTGGGTSGGNNSESGNGETAGGGNTGDGNGTDENPDEVIPDDGTGDGDTSEYSVTVTFFANNKEFAKKDFDGNLSEDGKFVIVNIDTLPSLQPALSGSWSYNNTPINQNPQITIEKDVPEIIIEWK